MPRSIQIIQYATTALLTEHGGAMPFGDLINTLFAQGHRDAGRALLMLRESGVLTTHLAAERSPDGMVVSSFEVRLVQ